MNDTLLFAQIASAGDLPDSVLKAFARRARLRRHVARADERFRLTLLSSASPHTARVAAWWVWAWANLETRSIA